MSSKNHESNFFTIKPILEDIPLYYCYHRFNFVTIHIIVNTLSILGNILNSILIAINDIPKTQMIMKIKLPSRIQLYHKYVYNWASFVIFALIIET